MIFFLKFSKIMHYQLIVLILLIFLCDMVWAIQILKFKKKGNCKQDFETPNDFSWKNDEYQVCTTHQDLPSLFWLFFHMTLFEQFEF